ncbi:hypothetical protein [Kribbella sp. NPDC051770]|uniref:hypothetical protein n=1 Tax=Kribbella sp. NPDC051770 TaxID=3155413 RepID=UPI0034439DF1
MRPERRRGQELLDQLAEAYDGVPGVDRAAMFGSEALRVLSRGEPKVFAFVGREGELVVKLPGPRVKELRAGDGREVRVGRNPAREWVGLPYSDDPQRWRDLLAEAHAFVGGA